MFSRHELEGDSFGSPCMQNRTSDPLSSKRFSGACRGISKANRQDTGVGRMQVGMHDREVQLEAHELPGVVVRYLARMELR